MRVIFLGTPEFAVPTLQCLIDEPDFEVVAAVCQPDRPKGRGNKIAAPPVKELAVKHGIPVLQPEKLSKAEDIVEQMRQLKPDVIVMVAFGQILKKAVLNMAPHGVINLHGSVLPKYRGAAPINWMLINGETKAGVTTMQTDSGVDTGAMLLKAEIDVDDDMNAVELSEKLSKIGAPLIIETLKQIKAGTIKPEVQNEEDSSHISMLNKEMGDIDWRKSARAIHNLVRGLQPWPGTFSGFRGAPIKIDKTQLLKGNDPTVHGTAPGSIILVGKDVLVSCGQQGQERLKLITVKPPGKGGIDARNWANGAHLVEGDRFDTLEHVKQT